jgi:hypothetical protein
MDLVMGFITAVLLFFTFKFAWEFAKTQQAKAEKARKQGDLKYWMITSRKVLSTSFSLRPISVVSVT